MSVPEAVRRQYDTFEVEAWLLAEATRGLADLGGVWPDPKPIGIYVCRR